MKIVIATGGTGGHIYPAIAVARELEKFGDVGVMFTIAGRRVEKEIFSKEGFKVTVIPSSAWYENSFYKNIVGCAKILWGVLKALMFMFRVRPNVVLLMGGYMSVPVAISGYLLRIPMVVHEQNFLPGMAVRFLSRMAVRVALSYSETQKYLSDVNPEKFVVTGNPIRFYLEDIKQPPLSERRTLLVFGGSQGSSLINRIIVDVLREIGHRRYALKVFHITGLRDYKWVKEAILGMETNSIDVRVVPYCHDILNALLGSRLVISRAGASTISEISAVGRASILIPFAAAKEGHQYYNARVLADAGAAVIVDEESLSAERLVSLIEDMFFDENRLLRMEQASRKVAKPYAAKRLASVLREVAG